MARDLNQCNFIGRLGRDVDMRYAANGNAIANFSIACSDDYKDKQGNKVEQTNWVNVVMFGRQAEVAGEYLSKGKQVFISGKMVTEMYEKNGQKQYSTKIHANDMQMLGSNASGQSGNQRPAQQSGQARPQQAAQGGTNFDDIPF